MPLYVIPKLARVRGVALPVLRIHPADRSGLILVRIAEIPRSSCLGRRREAALQIGRRRGDELLLRSRFCRGAAVGAGEGVGAAARAPGAAKIIARDEYEEKYTTISSWHVRFGLAEPAS